jgi:dihydroorotase
MKLINNCLIINEGRSFTGTVLIEGQYINKVIEGRVEPNDFPDAEVIDGSDKWLLPGMIDDQVHFREPGLTCKGDIASESRAAVAGGITTFMDMPNTKPQTTTIEALMAKLQRASETSIANYSFFFGGTNNNADLIKDLDRAFVPGIKLFLGASTGNMLVDDKQALRQFFGQSDFIVAVHAEDENIIRINRDYYTSKYGEELDITFHPKIRDAEACYRSSSFAVKLARESGTRLHIFHLSTARELELLDRGDLAARRITGEVCVHHLLFSDDDYSRLGNLIKWNPSIKAASDREALRKAVREGVLTVVATDHAPHLLSEKQGNCLKAASGGPMVQHALPAMLELAKQGYFSKERVVELTAHNPAKLFGIDRRGFVRAGYYADLVLIDPNKTWTVRKNNIFYKCGWSPLEGTTLNHYVSKTFVNGDEVYADGCFKNKTNGLMVKYMTKSNC